MTRLLLATLLTACASTGTPEPAAAAGDGASSPAASSSAVQRDAHPHPKADPRAVFGRATPAPEAGQAVAVFAAGCFWCIEKPFDAVDGVLATTSGYTDGPEIAPTYEQVGRHQTGHAEAIRVLYDPAKVSYAELLDVFWHNIDPTQANGQFCDRGEQYRSGIYVGSDEERRLAEASRDAVAAQLGATVVTEIDAVSPFWPAEDYHQDFYDKEPSHYQRYRLGCGRDARLKQLWGDAAVAGAGGDWVLQAAGGAAAPTAPDAAPAGMLPTPYTADQIRLAMPVGTTLSLTTETPKGTEEASWEVVAADAEQVTIRYQTAGSEEVEESSDRWTALRDHASFPAEGTTVETLGHEVLGRTRTIHRYTLHEDGEVVRRFDFADDLPGPPVEMEVTRGGQRVVHMRLTARTAPGG